MAKFSGLIACLNCTTCAATNKTADINHEMGKNNILKTEIACKYIANQYDVIVVVRTAAANGAWLFSVLSSIRAKVSLQDLR